MAERLNKDSFQEKVLNASGLAIADFYSDSCIPCKKLSQILADLDEKYPDVYIGKVNIVYEQELIEEYSVMSSPVLIFFKNGEEVDRITGAVSKHKIEEAIEKNK